MERGKLDPTHAKIVRDSLGPMQAYLNRLRDRLLAVGFPPGHSLVHLVDKARDALHDLSVELHYLSCTSGVGRDPS